MLDGRVLEASQVEYKPFGKPPLQREVASSKALQHKCHLCSIPGAPLARIGARPRLPGIEAAPSRYTRLISTCRSACRMNMFFPDTQARRVIRIIRIIRSYGHTAWRCATRPRLPGIEASPAAPPARHRSLQPAKPAPRSGFFPGKKFQSSRGGRPAFFANGCEAPAARHSPAAPAQHRSLQPAEPAPGNLN